MGIKDNDTQNGAMKEAFANAHERAPQFDASRAAEPQQGLRGMARLNALISRPMSRSGVGEQLTAYLEAMREAVRKELLTEADRYVFLPIDRATYELPVNVIVVSQLVRHNNGTSILTYPVLLEPAEGLPSRYVQMGQNEYEIPTTTSDAHDARLYQAISSVLANHFKKDAASIDEVAYNIIPNDLLPTDETRMARLASLVINTIDGAAKELPGNEEERFNAQMICGTKNQPTGARLFGRMDFNPAPKETVTGLPIRTDVTVSTKLVMPDAGKQDVSVAAPSASVLTQLGGYFDLMYVEPEMVAAPGGFGQLVKSTNVYQARFIITSIDVETNGVTPELALLALASSYMLNSNNAWISAFRKRHGVEGDTRDIGAIGFEVPVDEKGTLARIDTSASDFNLFQCISRYFRQGIVFSIDVDQGGDDSWVWENLEYAANGDVAAIENFITVADNVSNGNFSRLWNSIPAAERVIAKHSGNSLSLGYFNNGAVKEDLRKVDYLAALNLFGADDLQTVIDYANTFDPSQGDPVIRLGDRTRKQRSILQDNVHYKKTAQRYDINPLVLETLVIALQHAGLNIIPETFFGEYNQTTRGNADMVSFATRPSTTPLFSTAPRQAGASQFSANLLRPNSFGGRFGSN